MERVVVGESGWSKEDLKTDPDKLLKISRQMESVVNTYSNNECPNSEEMIVLFENIGGALYKWTGATYVGVKKDAKLELAYTKFYDSLFDLLICLFSVNEYTHKIAKRMLYRGVLYRYLGHASGSEDYFSRVEPEYNGVWVSWSKDDVRNNCYLGSKLYGTRTVLICETDYPFGIDLTGWDELFGTNIVRANETEVVYPTLKNTIKDVIYIDVKKGDDGDE